MLKNGKTSPPNYITEPELIGLMDINGIGTDATMATHIETIIAREYVTTRPQGRAAALAAENDEEEFAPAERGHRRGQGSSSGSAAPRAGSRSAVKEFIPTVLGVALVEGYDAMGLDVALSKPFLRKEMEAKLSLICSGEKTRIDVTSETIRMYREVFELTVRNMEIFKQQVRRRVVGQ
jgi:DNA topoisomerase-3